MGSASQTQLVVDRPLARWPDGGARAGARGVAAALDYFALGKPRIITLLVITGLCAMVVAAHGLPEPGTALAAMLGLALSAAGGNAVNMWYDRDIDAVMMRTRGRPIPAGRMKPGHALAFGIACQAVSLPVMGLTVGWLAASLSLAGFVYYVFIYTFWLKRRTPQNIVIGGAAGAFPPLVGWAAVTHSLSLAPLLMFLVVFLWTPPHFWALALYRQDDYRRAGIPMMPVSRGDEVTKRQILMYTLLLLAGSVALFWTHTVGMAYLIAAVILGAGFVACAVVLLRERTPHVAWAKRTFRYSLIYLGVLFTVMIIAVK